MSPRMTDGQHLAVIVWAASAVLGLAMMWARARRMRRRARAEDNERIELAPVMGVLKRQWLGTLALVFAGIVVVMATFLSTSEASLVTWGVGGGVYLMVIGVANFTRRERLLGRLARTPEPLRSARSRGDGLVFLFNGDAYLGWLRASPAALERAGAVNLPAARIHRDG